VPTPLHLTEHRTQPCRRHSALDTSPQNACTYTSALDTTTPAALQTLFCTRHIALERLHLHFCARHNNTRSPADALPHSTHRLGTPAPTLLRSTQQHPQPCRRPSALDTSPQNACTYTSALDTSAFAPGQMPCPRYMGRQRRGDQGGELSRAPLLDTSVPRPRPTEGGGTAAHLFVLLSGDYYMFGVLVTELLALEVCSVPRGTLSGGLFTCIRVTCHRAKSIRPRIEASCLEHRRRYRGCQGGGARRGGALPPAGERPLTVVLPREAANRACVVVRRQAEAEDGGDGPRRDSRRRSRFPRQRTVVPPRQPPPSPSAYRAAWASGGSRGGRGQGLTEPWMPRRRRSAGWGPTARRREAADGGATERGSESGT
jgi:hypothetical protein